MMYCSEKAFAMCPDRALCGSRSEATFTEDSECAAFNRSVEDLPMTNADMLRAMSDEQLASWACEQPAGTLFFCGVACRRGCEAYSDAECKARILHWLQQPAGEK